MDCPKCGAAMTTGESYIAREEGSRFLAGYRLQGLFPFPDPRFLIFKAPDFYPHRLFSTADSLPAHYCDACGTFLIEGVRRGISALEK